VAHRLDIVPVRIEHEGAVVVGVIVRPQAGRAVVLGAGRKRRLVERVDARAVIAMCMALFSPPSPPIQKSGLPPAPKPQALASCSCCGTSMIST
jgi:hypothetical protein